MSQEEKLGQTDDEKPLSRSQKMMIGSRRALYGGILTAGVTLAGQWLLGNIYGAYEGRHLLGSMTNSALYFGSAVVTAAATILALMLTILSLTSQADDDFSQVFYLRVQRIGKLAAISLIGGILLLLFLNIPIKDSDEIPGSWFTTIYYTLMTFLALLAGLIVTIVLMLLNAITSLIDTIRPTPEQDKEDDENDEDQDNLAKVE